MSLCVRKREGESWREAAARYAEPYGLDHEVLMIFDREVAAGTPESEAAFNACYEWDVTELCEDEP